VHPINWRRLASHALPVLVLLAGWGLRVHALGAKSLWYDELRQVEVAQAPLSNLEDLLIEHAARPLDYLVTHALLPFTGPVDAVAGRAEFWLRFPAAVWGLLTLAAFWPLARRWLKPPAANGLAAALAGGLLAAAPLAVQYSQELRPYALYLLISVLSFYCLDCALGLGRRPKRAPALHWAAFRAAVGRRHAHPLLLCLRDFCPGGFRGGGWCWPAGCGRARVASRGAACWPLPWRGSRPVWAHGRLFTRTCQLVCQ